MPDLWMDVDTALAEVPVNIMPLLDDTDFKTRETAIAYDAAGMDLVWNFVTPGGAMTQTAVTPTTGGNYDWAHQGDGMYSIEIPASGGASINNDTEGFGWFTGVVTGVLPWRGPVIGFRAAGLNDKMIESAYDTTRGLAGTALPGAAAEAAGGLYTRGSGAGQINQNANGQVDARAVAISAGAIDAAAIATGAIDADALAADASTEINSAVLAVLGALADAAADGDPTNTDTLVAYIKQLVNILIGTTGIVTFPASATPANNVSLAEVIRQIYDEVAGLNGGALLDAAGIRSAVGLASANLDTQLDALPTAAENADAVLDEDMTAHQTQGSLGQAIGDPVADANTIYGAVVTGAAGATIAADIIDIEGKVDDLETRLGTPSDLGSGATVAANLVDIEAQTDDIGVAGAGLTAIPWNTSWDAEVESEVIDALVARGLVLASGTADSGSTTSMVDAERTEADADYWKGRLLVFISGNIAGQAAIITDFNAGTDTFTFAPAVTQAVSTQNYVILPSVSVWDDTLAEHLAAGSTGAALNGASAPSAASIADAVWDETLADHLTAGSTGAGLNAAGSAGDPWNTALPGAYGAGSAGNILGNRLVGTIASGTHNPQSGDAFARLGAPAGASVSADIADVEGKVDDLETRLGTPSNFGSGATVAANLVDIEAQTDDIGVAGAGLTALGDARLANLDATVSSRLASASYTAPPSAASIADAVLDEDMTAHQTQGSLGQAIGDPGADADTLYSLTTQIQADTDDIQTRLPAALVGGRIDASVGAMAANTLTASALATDAREEIADQVWNETLAGHLGAGSTGEKLNAAGAAGDPWSTLVPGAYGAGTAGHKLGNLSVASFPAGAIEYTYTVTNSVGGAPLEGVEVWISTDNPATNIIWKGDTDAFGIARDVNGNKPLLDAGTYYFWRQLAGFTFTNPDTEAVS